MAQTLQFGNHLFEHNIDRLFQIKVLVGSSSSACSIIERNQLSPAQLLAPFTAGAAGKGVLSSGHDFKDLNDSLEILIWYRSGCASGREQTFCS